ncbi:hypothetical protein [Pseudidiomarina insulisalsae]|nr:hypothetical protein [Pseudidiomarina insulisalsae]
MKLSVIVGVIEAMHGILHMTSSNRTGKKPVQKHNNNQSIRGLVHVLQKFSMDFSLALSYQQMTHGLNICVATHVVQDGE